MPLSPEASLVYASAGPPEADERMQRILDDPVRWDRVAWLAIRERAAPVLWRRVRRLGAVIPPQIAEELRRNVMVGEFAANRLGVRLDDTVKALEAGGVEVVPLKGAALVLGGYVAARDRPMGDIDLLIRHEDAVRSREAAEAAGWEQPSVYDESDYQLHHHLAPLTDHVGDMRLELHTDLFPGRHTLGGFTRSLRERANGLGSAARIPTATDMVFHLALHFAWSHMAMFGTWRTFQDLRQLQISEAIDWGDLLRLVREYGGKRCCYWTLRLAHDVAAVPVPTEVLSELQPLGGTGAVLRRHLLCQIDTPDRWCPSTIANRFLWRKAMCDRDRPPPLEFPWEIDPRGHTASGRANRAKLGWMSDLALYAWRLTRPGA